MTRGHGVSVAVSFAPNWTCDVRTKRASRLASLYVYPPQKNPEQAAKSASLISERGVNTCYSPLETIRSKDGARQRARGLSLALALAAPHCAAAICLSAVGPCYLVFPFGSRSFTAAGPSRHRGGRGGTGVPGRSLNYVS